MSAQKPMFLASLLYVILQRLECCSSIPHNSVPSDFLWTRTTGNLNSPCISTYINVYEASEDHHRIVIANSMTYVFVSFRPPYLGSSEGHKHGVSTQMQSLINLSKTFLRISPARNIAQTGTFATLFEYSSSFISLILDFICSMVLMMVWQWKPAKS